MLFKTICFTLILGVINAQVKDYYTGAVVEYNAIYNKEKSPAGNIQENADKYLKIIQEAKAQDADIIVFPEFGLTTTALIETVIGHFARAIPDPKNKIVVCDTKDNWTEPLVKLSCAAKNNSIYVVVNFPESFNSTAEVVYSTNIVFDRTGALIAKYRQFNVLGSMFNKTENADLTTFETDFGVTFGTFNTIDMLFSQPSLELLRKNNKVTDIIYTTSWKSELPFLTNVQMQTGWARANGVNLLASSFCDPKKHYGGSGIFQANGDIYNSIPEKAETSVLIKKVRKISVRTPLETINNTIAQVKTFKNSTSGLQLIPMKENMTKYTTELLTKTETDTKICHKDLCCSFAVKFTPKEQEDYFYKLVVYDGPRLLMNSEYHVQVCGIVACLTEKDESCGQINSTLKNFRMFNEIIIRSNTFLDQGNTVILPSVVRSDLNVLTPSNYTYIATKSDCYRVVEMTITTPVKEILGFGVFSLTLDHPDVSSGLSGAVIAIIVIAVLVVLAIIGLLIWKRFKTGNYKHPGGN